MSKKEKEVVAVPEVTQVVKSAEYFRLVRTDRNMFTVECVTVVGDKVTEVTSEEATYLPIAFDKLRRKTGETFFKAVQDEARGTH